MPTFIINCFHEATFRIIGLFTCKYVYVQASNITHKHAAWSVHACILFFCNVFLVYLFISAALWFYSPGCSLWVCFHSFRENTHTLCIANVLVTQSICCSTGVTLPLCMQLNVGYLLEILVFKSLNSTWLAN